MGSNNTKERPNTDCNFFVEIYTYKRLGLSLLRLTWWYEQRGRGAEH